MTRLIAIILGVSLAIAIGALVTVDASWPWSTDCINYYNGNGSWTYYERGPNDGIVVRSTPCASPSGSDPGQPSNPNLNNNPSPGNGNSNNLGPGNPPNDNRGADPPRQTGGGGSAAGGGSFGHVATGDGDCAEYLSWDSDWAWWGQTGAGLCVFDLNAAEAAPLHYAVVEQRDEVLVWTLYPALEEGWVRTSTSETDRRDCTALLSSDSRWTSWGRNADGQCVFDLNAPPQRVNQYAVFSGPGQRPVWTFFAAPEPGWIAARAALDDGAVSHHAPLAECADYLAEDSYWTWWGQTSSDLCAFDLNTPEAAPFQYAIVEDQDEVRVWTFYPDLQDEWVPAPSVSVEAP